MNLLFHDPGIRWWFCTDCGLSLFYDCDDASEKIYVAVASLTGPLDRQPDGHVSFEEKPTWIEVGDYFPKYIRKTDQLI